MEHLMQNFGLTAEQTQILFSLQRLIVENDIQQTAQTRGRVVNYHQQRALIKAEWLKQWENAINDYLAHLDSEVCRSAGGSSDDTTKRSLLTDGNSIKSAILATKSETEIWKYLILLEAVAFIPYYPLGGTKEEMEQSAKLYAGLKLDDKSQMATLIYIAELLDVPPTYITKFKDALLKSTRQLSGFYTMVAIGVGSGILAALMLLVPFIGHIASLFAAEGLAGAAAVNAGLAVLGGGAVAAGGFGVAGGIAVIVGGGTLLGVGVGGSVGLAVAQVNSKAVLREAVKLEVVMKEILLAVQQDTKSFQEILAQLITEQQKMKINLEQLKAQQEKDKVKIKELERSLKYLTELIKNLQK